MNQDIKTQAELKKLAELRKSPLISLPALAILIVYYVVYIALWKLSLDGHLNNAVGVAVAAFIAYLAFTPSHDAMHRAFSRIEWVNSLGMRLATFVAVPFGSGKLFRAMHMQHHRFANDEKDPDHALSSHLKFIPLWGVWPFLYLWTYARNKDQYPPLSWYATWGEGIVGMSVIAVMFWYFPEQMLYLWALPMYFAFFLMCVVFMVLPHYPHHVKDSENPYQATVIRTGWEWLLTPLMMYQNYHLVHHLYPTVPFYRYKKAWLAREDFHEAQHPARVSAFQFFRD